jgi:phosphatidate cytidylyltransferase
VLSGLAQRIATALVLAAVVVGVLFWTPAAVAVVVIVAAFLIGAWEWAGLAGLASSAHRGLYVAAIAVGIALAWRFTGDPAQLTGFLKASVLWWLAAFAWVALASQRGGRIAATVVGFLVLVPATIGLARLVVVEPNGRELLLYLFVLIAAADAGAYFGGRTFGRHKLAPHVSPGKTWEGLIAGMLCAAVAAAFGARLFAQPPMGWIGLCVLVALISVVGDLLESMFKRHVGLKDSGRILPGHGGVLDRVDSLTAAGPTFLLGLYALGIAP